VKVQPLPAGRFEAMASSEDDCAIESREGGIQDRVSSRSKLLRSLWKVLGQPKTVLCIAALSFLIAFRARIRMGFRSFTSLLERFIHHCMTLSLMLFASNVVVKVIGIVLYIVLVMPVKLAYFVISSPVRLVYWIIWGSASANQYTSPEGRDIPEPYDMLHHRAMCLVRQSPPNLTQLFDALYHLDPADQMHASQVLKATCEAYGTPQERSIWARGAYDVLRQARSSVPSNHPFNDARRGHEDFEDVTPDDSISNMGNVDIAGAPAAGSQVSASASVTSQATGSVFSGSTTEQRCFIKGSLLADLHERLVRVEELRQFDHVRAANGQPLRIMRVIEHEGPHAVVTLQVGDARLCVTSSHRIVVLRGGEQVSAPASSLRAGDDVVCGCGVQRLIEAPTSSIVHLPAFQLLFDPDMAVETFCGVPTHAVLTMGHRPPRGRRQGRHTDLVSIPDTHNSWD